mgnify:CR=1 FL=1
MLSLPSWSGENLNKVCKNSPAGVRLLPFVFLEIVWKRLLSDLSNNLYTGSRPVLEESNRSDAKPKYAIKGQQSNSRY